MKHPSGGEGRGGEWEEPELDDKDVATLPNDPVLGSKNLKTSTRYSPND